MPRIRELILLTLRMASMISCNVPLYRKGFNIAVTRLSLSYLIYTYVLTVQYLNSVKRCESLPTYSLQHQTYKSSKSDLFSSRDCCNAEAVRKGVGAAEAIFFVGAWV